MMFLFACAEEVDEVDPGEPDEEEDDQTADSYREKKVISDT